MEAGNLSNEEGIAFLSCQRWNESLVIQQLAQGRAVGSYLNQVSNVSGPNVRVCSLLQCAQHLQMVQPTMWMATLGVGGWEVDWVGSAVELQKKKKEQQGAWRSWRACLELGGSCLNTLANTNKFWQTFCVLAPGPSHFLLLPFLLFF